MKFIHCADIHLNSKVQTIPLEKSRVIREEVFRAFENLCGFAKENSVTAVIISGDMFDGDKITQKIFERVFSAISNANPVEFLYLSGNHDEDVFNQIDLPLPDNFKCFTDEWSCIRYGKTVVSGIVFNDANGEFIYDKLNLSEADVNIVALHGQVVGYNSNEKAEIISIPKLKNKCIDYLALGHIHSYSLEKLDTRGVYAYSGCLCGRGFDETGEKGFVLLTVEDGKIDGEFIKFADRNFCEIEYDITMQTDWFEIRKNLFDKLKSKFDKKSLIKIILKGETTPELEIDIKGLASYLNEYFFFVKIYDETTLKINFSDYETDKSIKGEFVRAVLLDDISEEEKSKIIMCGLKAFKGEI